MKYLCNLSTMNTVFFDSIEIQDKICEKGKIKLFFSDRHYYYNTKTQKTSYEKIKDVKTSYVVYGENTLLFKFTSKYKTEEKIKKEFLELDEKSTIDIFTENFNKQKQIKKMEEKNARIEERKEKRKIDEARIAKEKEEREKREKEELQETLETIRTGERVEVDGEKFVRLIRLAEMKVSIRTIGFVLNKVSSITLLKGVVSGMYKKSNSNSQKIWEIDFNI